jgi:DNA gyrase/topoisomerase IV subunit A
MNEKASKATDPCDLERQILDPNIAKNEAEWWAGRRIQELEEEAKRTEQFIIANDIYISELRARLKLLEACIAADDTLISILKNELKDISEALNDPRVDVTITMVDKIKELQGERKKHD